jgi:hypothetical protein
MRITQITETSPLTVEGSFTKDLLISKLWLWKKLSDVLAKLDIDHVNTVYVLGSWTGTVSMILAAEDFPTDVIINVDQDPKWIAASKKLSKRMGFQNIVRHQASDANQVDYDQIEQPSVVINTSINDMAERDWFDNIPSGTIVVLQGRDAAESAHSWDTLDNFVRDYPMQQVLFQSQLTLEDPETEYHRYMVIGIR